MTKRDYDIIDFLAEYKVATTDTIQQLFFPSLRMCQQRLKILHEQGHVKRTRATVSNKYAFFVKRPVYFRHSLLVTDFYRELARVCEVAKFRLEPTIGDIRPDAVIGYKSNGKNAIALLEVELSNKGFNYAKYERFDFSRYFPVQPRIIVVGDKVKPTMGFHVIDTSLTGIRAAVR